MKHLFVLLIFFSLKNGLQAQVTDSTMVKADSARASNMSDSAGAGNLSDSGRAGNMNNTMNSSSTMADSSKASISNRMDSMNNSSNRTATTNRMDGMNNSSNSAMSNSNNSGISNTVGTMQNPMNSQGMEGYAALPVMESYIPADVMDKIKSKYGSGTIIYDVTAVRAAMLTDSVMQAKDSSMRQPQPDSASTMAMTAAPVKYNYVVRIIKDGVMQTEYVADNGTTTVKPG